MLKIRFCSMEATVLTIKQTGRTVKTVSVPRVGAHVSKRLERDQKQTFACPFSFFLSPSVSVLQLKSSQDNCGTRCVPQRGDYCIILFSPQTPLTGCVRMTDAGTKMSGTAFIFSTTCL